MAVTDAKMHPAGKTALKQISVPIITATSQAAVKALSMVPGYKFELVGVEVWATAITATISVDVKINGVSVLTGAITPVAGSRTAGVLVANRLNRRGSAAQALDVEYTTNGTGAGTNLRVLLTYRPYPLNGEV